MLAAVVVTVAIIAILAAVVVPTMAGYRHQADVVTAARLLEDVRDGIVATTPRSGFRPRIGVYPMLVSDLTAGITTAKFNSCRGPANVYSAAQMNRWNNARFGGPFAPQVAGVAGNGVNPTGGVWTPIGFIVDTLVRGNCGLVGGTNPSGQALPMARKPGNLACTGALTLAIGGTGTGATNNYLALLVRGIPVNDAKLLDLLLENQPINAAPTPTTGLVRYFEPSAWPPDGGADGTDFADVLYLVATNFGQGAC